MRFLKTGSEACSAAVRIARAYTGKDFILSDGYHGWSDGFVSMTPPAIGVKDPHFFYPLKEARNFDRAAAVIIEPVITDHSSDRIQYLRELREKCTKEGVLLIFDETITGMRFPRLSVANWCGVAPDIAILGKAIGGGFPLSVVGGRKDIMEQDYFVSSTFAGDTIALAACKRLFEIIHNENSVERIWNDGEIFKEEFNKISPDFIRLEGYPTRGVFKGTEIGNALFFQEAVKAGVLFGSSWFYCLPHADERHRVIALCKTIISRIEKNEVKLEGEMPKKPYAQKVRS
jgi:glutamate-1-semialdehyde aminotransferase